MDDESGMCLGNILIVGKAEAAISAFREGYDYVYVHVEAPDECGHRAETENKVLSIEKIDSEILAPVLAYLRESGEDFKILVLPDHPTPICKRTHTMDAVPFILYTHGKDEKGVDCYNEESARAAGLYVSKGENLMELFINGNLIK